MVRRFLLSVIALAMFAGVVSAQTSQVSYYMNDASGGDVGRTATVTGALALSASNFTNSPSGSVVTPGTDVGGDIGPFVSTNDALRFTTSSASFSFSVTVPAGPAGWELNNYGFDVRTAKDVHGSYALFLDTGAGFVQVAGNTLGSLQNPSWRAIGDSVPSTVIFPGATVGVRIDFTGFTVDSPSTLLQYDVDSLFLRGASNTTAIPEPATIALLGISGVAAAVSVWYRRRKTTRQLEAVLQK